MRIPHLIPTGGMRFPMCYREFTEFSLILYTHVYTCLAVPVYVLALICIYEIYIYRAKPSERVRLGTFGSIVFDGGLKVPACLQGDWVPAKG